MKSGIEIGVRDEINKGLGFEKCILNEPDSQLTPEEAEILLSQREKIVRFMTSLASELHLEFINIRFVIFQYLFFDS